MCRALESVTQTGFIDHVAHALTLGLEVLVIVRAHSDEQRNLLRDVDAKATQLLDLLGVVGQQSDLLNTEVGKDSRRGGVVTRVCRKTEGKIRIDGGARGL